MKQTWVFLVAEIGVLVPFSEHSFRIVLIKPDGPVAKGVGRIGNPSSNHCYQSTSFDACRFDTWLRLAAMRSYAYGAVMDGLPIRPTTFKPEAPAKDRWANILARASSFNSSFRTEPERADCQHAITPTLQYANSPRFFDALFLILFT